jgi:hypothetical protein
MPHDLAIDYQERLRRFVADVKPGGNFVGQAAILDNEDDSARQIAKARGEIHELVVRLRADRTLRAMLENQNGLSCRPL